ncbi:hypothetical protein IMG5_084740, partial [Ichthyophthirius multifiliis]
MANVTQKYYSQKIKCNMQSDKKKDILALLLISSKFEDKFKICLQKLIQQKQEKWDIDRLKCTKRMEELAKFFAGGYQLGENQGDEGYKEWFEEMKNQIEKLQYGDTTYIGRKVKQLIEALEDIEQYDQVSRSIQIKQYLYDTRKDLKHMMRIVNLKEEYLTNISLISDVTYCWQSLQDGYIQIILFTESILSMEKYLIGVIEVNPKQILDDGIRKELLKLIAKQLDQRLMFNNGDINKFLNTLFQLQYYLQGFKKSLEYIQDFIGNYGLRIFHEEFERLIISYIDMEQIAFITKKLDYEELLYDDNIPMPDRQNMENNNSVNFMGRILNEIMKLTDFKNTVYVHQNIAFYSFPKGQEMLNLKIMNMLYKCIGISGLNGLDQLLSFMIASSITTLIRKIKKQIGNEL